MMIIVKDQQILIAVDSQLFTTLLELAIYAKNHLKNNDSEWTHSPELYEEMLNKHKKAMKVAIELSEGIHQL